MSIKSPIVISSFKKQYPNKTIVVPDLQISNRVSLLVGKNGSGKSTLLKAIMNIISYKGEIRNTNTLSFMPENPTFPLDITIREFLDNHNHIFKSDYDYKLLLSSYKLLDKIDELISSLSKGMKVKLNLILCLMKNSEIYILDEPLSGLDDQSVKILISHVSKSTKSFIISTHLEEAFTSVEREVIRLDKCK